MLIRNSLIYVIAKFIPGILGVATTALLTRLLDPDQYGVYGLALLVMTFGSRTMFDWLGVSFLRFYQSRRGDPRVIVTFVMMFVALAVLTLALALLLWITGAISSHDAPVYAVGVVMACSFAWFELAARFEIAAFRPGRYLAMNFVRAGGILVCAAGAAWLTRDPVWTGCGTAAGTILGGFFGGMGGGQVRWTGFDRTLARAVVVFGLPLALSLALGGLVGSGTRAMLEVMDSPAALGLYTAAAALVENTLSVAAASIASAGYSLAVQAVESGDALAARQQLLANGTMLLAVLAPAAVGLALTAHGIAAILVGPNYVDAAAILTPWLAAGAFFGGFRAHFLDHAFQLGHRPDLQVHVTALAAACAIFLGWLLIPRYGPVGCGAAMTVAMAGSCLHARIAGKRGYPLPLPVAAFVRIGFACAGMALVVAAIPDGAAPAVLLRVIAGGLAYSVSVIALNVLGLRDKTAGWVRIRVRRLAFPIR